jgi:hypothetical protein
MQCKYAMRRTATKVEDFRPKTRLNFLDILQPKGSLNIKKEETTPRQRSRSRSDYNKIPEMTTLQ